MLEVKATVVEYGFINIKPDLILLYYARDKNVKKIFCPGIEAMGIIVASPSCTEYHWGTLIAFYFRSFSMSFQEIICYSFQDRAQEDACAKRRYLKLLPHFIRVANLVKSFLNC